MTQEPTKQELAEMLIKLDAWDDDQWCKHDCWCTHALSSDFGVYQLLDRFLDRFLDRWHHSQLVFVTTPRPWSVEQ